MKGDARKILLCLKDGPATVNECATSTGMSKRRANVAMWLLINAGRARKTGRVIRNGRGKSWNIYESIQTPAAGFCRNGIEV